MENSNVTLINVKYRLENRMLPFLKNKKAKITYNHISK